MLFQSNAGQTTVFLSRPNSQQNIGGLLMTPSCNKFKSKFHIEKLKIAWTLLAIVVAMSSQVSRADALFQIRLRPTTVVPHPNVRLTDVATFLVDGKLCTLLDLPPELQVQLHKVEITRLSAGKNSAIVPLSTIQVRLQLMRIHRHAYDLIGPSSVRVTLAKPVAQNSNSSSFQFASAGRTLPAFKIENESVNQSQQSDTTTTITDLMVERAIKNELAVQFGLSDTELQVRLLGNVIPPDSKSLRSIRNPVIQITAPARFPYGRQSLPLRILDGQQIAMTRTVAVNIRRRQTVLLTRRPISGGQKIESSMLFEEVQFVDQKHDRLRIEDVVGKLAARALQSAAAVSWNDLRDASSVAVHSSKPVVNAREPVQVVAKRKGLRFTIPAAEALQSGRKGQLIRVKNLRSNKVISGRVIGPGLVEIIL